MDAMTNHNEVVKHMGDVGASAAAALVALSHWASILSPIVSLLVGAATLAWWALRFREWAKTGKVGK
jgi:Flp pilus assembly protein TadB